MRESAALAKEQGFAASGIDALARSAGLTSGAFYKHFEGKEALLAAICEAELQSTQERFSSIEPQSEEQVLRAVDAYLSLVHVRSPGAGCVLPALAAEMGRAPAATRAVVERAFEELVAVIAEKVGDRALGSALVTQCVGAVSVARALSTETAQREVLAHARVAVRRLLKA
ncbi:Transcriptional regulator, TetR family protein [Hyalangium minutum]|uniref:Transcriptional regulator, TetR family protein n=1 Tax=Hyalangium minutum TaxID=394096 RepID=A0A085WMG9_9BACT|nr:Transcriptional regulator, TetR family protein [Hyalangium minutum]